LGRDAHGVAGDTAERLVRFLTPVRSTDIVGRIYRMTETGSFGGG
jgi:hypothetical protein